MLGENASDVVRAGIRNPRWRRGCEGRVPLLSDWLRQISSRRGRNAKTYEGFGAPGPDVFRALGYKTDDREPLSGQEYRQRFVPAHHDFTQPISYGVDVTTSVSRILVDTPEIVCVKEETGNIRRVTTCMSSLATASRLLRRLMISSSKARRSA